MPVCIFEGCMSGSKKKNIVKDKNVHLHRFPKNIDLRNKWISQISQGTCTSIKNVDFEKGLYNRGSGKYKILKCSVDYTNIL